MSTLNKAPGERGVPSRPARESERGLGVEPGFWEEQERPGPTARRAVSGMIGPTAARHPVIWSVLWRAQALGALDSPLEHLESAVINLTPSGELRSAPSGPDARGRATGKRALRPLGREPLGYGLGARGVRPRSQQRRGRGAVRAARAPAEEVHQQECDPWLRKGHRRGHRRVCKRQLRVLLHGHAAPARGEGNQHSEEAEAARQQQPDRGQGAPRHRQLAAPTLGIDLYGCNIEKAADIIGNNGRMPDADWGNPAAIAKYYRLLLVEIAINTSNNTCMAVRSAHPDAIGKGLACVYIEKNGQGGHMCLHHPGRRLLQSPHPPTCRGHSHCPLHSHRPPALTPAPPLTSPRWRLRRSSATWTCRHHPGHRLPQSPRLLNPHGLPHYSSPNPLTRM